MKRRVLFLIACLLMFVAILAIAFPINLNKKNDSTNTTGEDKQSNNGATILEPMQAKSPNAERAPLDSDDLWLGNANPMETPPPTPRELQKSVTTQKPPSSSQ